MWISAGRDENFRIRGQTLISSRRTAGTVTYHAINESDPPLAMQMDSTTLQLIQVLERTVSSGECWNRAVVPWRRHEDRLARLRPSVFSSSGDATRVATTTAAPVAAATAAIAISSWSTREQHRRYRVRVAALGRFVATCSGQAAARLSRAFRSCGGASADGNRGLFRTLLRAISRPVVLLLGALFAAGKVLSRVTVASYSHALARHASRCASRSSNLRFSAILGAIIVQLILIMTRDYNMSLSLFQTRMSSWQRRLSCSRRPKPIS